MTLLMLRLRALVVRSAIIPVLMTLTACMDARSDVAGIPRGAADGLYPQVVVTGASTASPQLTLSLLRKPTSVRLGSYQGELSYDPSALRVEGAALPEGVDGAASVVAPGRIRFVGSALNGLGESPLLTVRFTRTGTVGAPGFAVAFEEVTDGSDLTDLTASVQGAAPLITVH